jgi:hypothetical protein
MTKKQPVWMAAALGDARSYRAVARWKTSDGGWSYWRGRWRYSREPAEAQARRWAGPGGRDPKSTWVEASDGERFKIGRKS